MTADLDHAIALGSARLDAIRDELRAALIIAAFGASHHLSECATDKIATVQLRLDHWLRKGQT